MPAVLPFYHIYGMIVVSLANLAHGSKIVTLPKFEPKSFFKLLDQHQVLSVPSNISTACFSQQYKYLSVILTRLTELCTFRSQNSPSFCCAIRELMKLYVQLVISLCMLYKALASELKFLPYEIGHEKVFFVETPTACLFFTEEAYSNSWGHHVHILMSCAERGIERERERERVQ